MRCVELLIGGKSVCAHGGATFDRIDPFTGEIASRAAAAASKMPTLRSTRPRPRSHPGVLSVPRNGKRRLNAAADLMRIACRGVHRDGGLGNRRDSRVVRL